MAENFLAGDFLAHAVTFGDFMAGNCSAGHFLDGNHLLAWRFKQFEEHFLIVFQFSLINCRNN